MSWNEKLTRVNAKSFEAIVASNSTKKKQGNAKKNNQWRNSTRRMIELRKE